MHNVYPGLKKICYKSSFLDLKKSKINQNKSWVRILIKLLICNCIRYLKNTCSNNSNVYVYKNINKYTSLTLENGITLYTKCISSMVF